LATSLFLGVLLISACTGLLALVRDGIASEERQLFGGDIDLDVREPLGSDVLNWISERGLVSRITELRTMVGSQEGDFTVIELQSVDEHYPLYGSVQFEPSMSLQDATADAGVAIDPALAIDLDLALGDIILVGQLELTVRAIILNQPDRALSADVRGPPVLVSQETLDATGLVTPTSRVEYEYRVRLQGSDIDASKGEHGDTSKFINEWRNAFPQSTAELNTVEDRNDRVAERLNEVAAVLLLIAVATLLVGGLGVANGVAAWLHSRREDLATLSAIGARNGWRSRVVVIEVLVVAAFTSGVAATLGGLIAYVLSRSLSDGLPVATSPYLLAQPTLISMAFGTLAALAFAAPNLARSLATSPARLLRGDTDHDVRTPLSKLAKTLCFVLGLCAALALIALVPDRIIGLGFIISMALLYLALSALVIALRKLARHIVQSGRLDRHFALRRAIAGLDQPGSALRPLLLSLGIATTLLVSATIVIVSMIQLLDNTVPARSPALAFYDIQSTDIEIFESTVLNAPSVTAVETVPLVLGRLTSVNGKQLSDRAQASEALEANDEHKLGYRVERVDNIRATSGELWSSDYSGLPLVAMEDREAGQIGVKVGDTLTFTIFGEMLNVELAAIYAQGNFETRFWFEALFSPGVLDPYITRYVGVAYQDNDTTLLNADIAAANAIAVEFPGVVTIRTARGLATAKRILNAAALAVSLVAFTSLLASLLVLASVVAANRQRQLQEAAILHAIGSRHRSLMHSLGIEYVLLGVVVAVFSTIVGSLLGTLVAEVWLELPVGQVSWLAGFTVAFGIVILCLGAGAVWVASALRATPAQLLREVG
jgi:putative ABC transport system permease protein